MKVLGLWFWAIVSQTRYGFPFQCTTQFTFHQPCIIQGKTGYSRTAGLHQQSLKKNQSLIYQTKPHNPSRTVPVQLVRSTQTSSLKMEQTSSLVKGSNNHYTNNKTELRTRNMQCYGFDLLGIPRKKDYITTKKRRWINKYVMLYKSRPLFPSNPQNLCQAKE